MTEAQKLQDNLGATKTVKLKYPVRLATGETLTDPNNPLPTPAIISGKQNPLLSLLPESVQAQASEVIKAVETGVKIYRAAESGIDEPAAETVNVDVSGQAIIVLPSAGSTTDSAVIDGLLAKIQQLEVAVKEADESSEIAALSEQLAVAQAAIKSAGSLEGRLKLLESSSANISEQAVELAKQKAELDKALNKLVESDATVSALKSQLEILRIQFDSAKGSDEIEALHLKISKVMADLEVAKQSAAAAEESEELAALQKKIEDLQALSATQNSITSEIAELRRLLGLRKCEKIHLTQDLWADGGYTWLEAKFKNTYNDPKVYLALEHKTMVVLFLNHNFGAKTGRSVRIRTNYDKPKIDVDYSVFLYVEEWSDSTS